MCTTRARHASLVSATHGRGARECCRDSSWLRRAPALASQPAKLRVEMATEKWEMAGEVGIDTGRLLLIDPGYVSELPDAGPYAAYGMRVPVAAGGGVSRSLAGAVPCPHLPRAGARYHWTLSGYSAHRLVPRRGWYHAEGAASARHLTAPWGSQIRFGW